MGNAVVANEKSLNKCTARCNSASRRAERIRREKIVLGSITVESCIHLWAFTVLFVTVAKAALTVNR